MIEFTVWGVAAAAWNLMVCGIYGIDKWKAGHEKWRISEQVLLLLAFLLGGFGAMTGMIWFHHKSSHWKFRILVPVAAILQFVVLGLLCRHGILRF